MQALPAIGSAVGFVGFVAVLGAAIEWVRFSAAGLPADQAVRVASRPELVATGAVSLIAFTLLGLLAVMVAYLADPRGEGTVRLGVWTVILGLGEALFAAWYTTDGWENRVVTGFALLGLAVSAGRVSIGIAHGVAARRELEKLRSSHEELREALEATAGDPANPDAVQRRTRAYHRLRVATAEADETLAEPADASSLSPIVVTEAAPSGEEVLELDRHARRVAQDISRKLARGGPRPPVGEAVRSFVSTQGVSASAMFILVVVILAVVIPSPEYLLLLVGVVIVLNTALFGVALATSRFRWYGVALFLSVPLFGAVLGGVRTFRSPKLQPVALIRKASDHAICGVYIAESNDRVYLGRVELKTNKDKRAIPGAGRIFWVPKSDVDMIKIGSPQSISDANGRAPELARELYDDRTEAPPQTVKPTTRVVVAKHGNATATTTRETPMAEQKPVGKGGAPQETSACSRVSLSKPEDAARTGFTPAALAGPKVGSVNESHRIWREGTKPVRVGKKGPPVGTTFVFTLTQQARVSLAFMQQIAGRKREGECVAETETNRTKGACRRSVARGTLSFIGHAGRNKVSLQGRISRSKMLKQGNYTLIITAANASGKSTSPQPLAFTIVK